MTPSPQQHFNAVISLVFLFFFFTMASPGLAHLSPGEWKKERFHRNIEKVAGTQFANFAVMMSKVNDVVRVPISSKFRRVERTFRIRQDWHLWPRGVRSVIHLEIEVDGELVHRTNDPDHDWQQERFNHRRMRPMAEAIAEKAHAYNWKGLGRWIIKEAQADFPGCQEVSIVSKRRGQLESPDQERATHGQIARAPDWVLEPIQDFN